VPQEENTAGAVLPRPARVCTASGIRSTPAGEGRPIPEGHGGCRTWYAMRGSHGMSRPSDVPGTQPGVTPLTLTVGGSSVASRYVNQRLYSFEMQYSWKPVGSGGGCDRGAAAAGTVAAVGASPGALRRSSQSGDASGRGAMPWGPSAGGAGSLPPGAAVVCAATASGAAAATDDAGAPGGGGEGAPAPLVPLGDVEGMVTAAVAFRCSSEDTTTTRAAGLASSAGSSRWTSRK
jgi:hypothetical protein